MVHVKHKIRFMKLWPSNRTTYGIITQKWEFVLSSKVSRCL